MTAVAQRLVSAFESLSAEEQREVTVEILRRGSGHGEMSDQAFDELAAEVFRGYDAEEAVRGDR